MKLNRKYFSYTITGIALAIYVVILIKLIVLKHIPLEMISERMNGRDNAYPHKWNSVNLIPFKTIMHYIQNPEVFNNNIIVNNILGNIVAFTPLGVFIGIFFDSKFLFLKIILYSLLLSLAFELSQFWMQLGSFDVDDLILNTLGGTLGYFVYIFFKKLFKKIQIPAE